MNQQLTFKFKSSSNAKKSMGWFSGNNQRLWLNLEEPSNTLSDRGISLQEKQNWSLFI